MHLRALIHSLALAVALAYAPAAASQDRSERSWSAAFADFFIGPEQKEEFRWTGRVAAGATLEIKGVNGGIRAEVAAGKDVEIVAVKKGRRSNPKQVEITMVEGPAGGLTVCALYPSPDSRPNECKPGDGGRMHLRNNDVSVEFVVKVPAGVSFSARTVNGSIVTERLAGNLEAHTINGSVKVAVDGWAKADTVNGSIQATLGKSSWREPLAFKSVNGSVTVHLPSDASTDVRCETVNGSISSDFTLTGETRINRRQLAGTIGRGGRELHVKTVNGSVRLRRAS